jgi:uncharacterized protein (DUF885 family)
VVNVRLPALALLAAAACATRGPAQPPSAEGRDRVHALEDEYLHEYFRRNPEAATRSGWPGADHAGLADVRPEAIADWQRFEDGILARTRAVDRGTLAGTPEAITLGILLEALEGSVATRPCRSELWAVSAIGGWPGQFASLAEIQPVGTPALNEAARTRLRRLAARIDAEIANLRLGAARGYVATRENVERVLGEVDRLLATRDAAWPLTRPGVRAGDAALEGELAGIVAREVRPAALRYRTFLGGEYRSRARSTPSLLALPDGDVCYRGSVRRRTTLSMEGKVIHEAGLARMEELQAEMRRIAERSFGTADVKGLLRRLREDPAFRFKDREEILAVTEAAVARAAAAAPRWFGHVPQAPVRVREYPEFRRASNPAESYTQDFSGGKLAGIYFINVFDPAHKPRALVEATAFHEAIPGHHFQIALAHERGAGSRIGEYVFNSGFVEGWALYAEHLALEMGVYSEDVYRLGGLASEAFRAGRLVVDPGMNVLGWSRQRAIDYLVDNAGIDPAFAASEVDRYVAWPGQATSYLLGALEILRLRGDAERALGARFDVRAFHDAVLEDGAITLPMLRERIGSFVAERRDPAAVQRRPVAR